MNTINCETYFAKATIGLYRGYSNITISRKEFKKSVYDVQKKLKQQGGIMLSAKLTDCEILFLGQDEPSITLEFINYPKFPMDLVKWKRGIVVFIEKLILELEQNRVVIVFHDETLMIDNSHDIDLRIQINS